VFIRAIRGSFFSAFTVSLTTDNYFTQRYSIMAKRGRPPKLDDVKRGQILGVLSVGGSMATAAAVVGCCTKTIYNTAQRDPKFFDALRSASAMEEVKLLKLIDTAAEDPRHWRAAAWKLACLDPDRYRPQPKNMISMKQMREFIDDLQKHIEIAIGDRATYDRVLETTNRQFNELSYENHGTVEFLLDRLAEERAEQQNKPLPADVP